MKIISIALFGTSDKYAKYLPSFIRAHLNLFHPKDDWALWLQLATDVDFKWRSLVRSYSNKGLLGSVEASPTELTRSMLWRMSPIFFENRPAQYVFCRDLDALPLPRDRAVCDQFIASGCFAHTVHDNRYHVGMMGGLCGFFAPAFREAMGWKSLDEVYAAGNASKEQWATHGTDQIVLNKLILTNPAVKLLEHRFNGWHGGPGKHQPRSGGLYQCQAWSTPVPDVGVSKLSPELTTQADHLANHLGSAGYDHEAALHFWDEHGDPEITARVREAEKGIL